jgi:hypothetical protein
VAIETGISWTPMAVMSTANEIARVLLVPPGAARCDTAATPREAQPTNSGTNAHEYTAPNANDPQATRTRVAVTRHDITG